MFVDHGAGPLLDVSALTTYLVLPLSKKFTDSRLQGMFANRSTLSALVEFGMRNCPGIDYIVLPLQEKFTNARLREMFGNHGTLSALSRDQLIFLINGKYSTSISQEVSIIFADTYRSIPINL
ncbi:hypothetical protein BDR06DRAFT_665401 [Suillus hirtellus]|nr:hypothetical protein BDR06DRAFT_665401 [Suillus hirtellus]